MNNDDDVVDLDIRMFAAALVRIGVYSNTNGLSLLKVLCAEIDGFIIPLGKHEDFAEWFTKGVPPEWTVRTRLEKFKED